MCQQEDPENFMSYLMLLSLKNQAICSVPVDKLVYISNVKAYPIILHSVVKLVQYFLHS